MQLHPRAISAVAESRDAREDIEDDAVPNVGTEGATGDANGPNNCDRNSDDVPGPKSADRPIMDRECMPDYTGDDWADQATTRSAHPGGVNLGMADGSAHFVSDSVDTDGSASTFHTNPDVQFKMSTWDRLIASSDGQVITESPF